LTFYFFTTPILHYSNTPLLLSIFVMNVGDWIRKWSNLQPKKKALYFEDHPFTYQEVNRRINQLCHLLLESGVKKQDRVAVLLYNCHQYLEIFLGLSKIGAILVPLNWRLAGPELEFILQDSGSRTLIFEVVSSIRSRLNFSDANDVQFIEELPKTASGKIQKFVLKEWHNTAKP
jgi:acyl-CoA synthetase (AMP-forming)/AMP-acid ligase II